LSYIDVHMTENHMYLRVIFGICTYIVYFDVEEKGLIVTRNIVHSS